VHSHPRTAPIPSQTDLAEARWPGVLSVIVGFEPEVELRAWALIFGPAGYAIRCEAVRVVASDDAEAGAGRREIHRLVR
jgi:proteasome lid subunit RPN8/RPN11